MNKLSQTNLVLMALRLGGKWSVQELERYTSINGNMSHRIAARVDDLRRQEYDVRGRYRKFPIYEYWLVA